MTFIRKFKCLGSIIGICLLLSVASCTDEPEITEHKPPVPPTDEDAYEYIGSIPLSVSSDIIITQQATKISQLTGDYDRHLGVPVLSQSLSRYRIEGIDLGVPFQDGDTTWILFGDTWGPKGGLLDAIGYTTDQDPEQGLKLDFIADKNGVYEPIHIPGIGQAAFEVPNEGIIDGDEFYVWHTTDHSERHTMGRNVLAHAYRADAEKAQYSLLYDYSTMYFINVSVVKVNNEEWGFLPDSVGEGLVILGSGEYRQSNVYLAYQPFKKLKDKSTIRYFSGMKEGKPLWSKNEKNAQPLFRMAEPGVGELSLSYNEFIQKWILLYNHHEPRGINMRTADMPWGPWTVPQVLFRPWEDGGYCHFMHTNWEYQQCDNVSNPGREYEWGGEYGPYQFAHFAKGDSVSTTIYFTMSTWNPYETVLMKASLKKR